jgi:hypothetical protein
VTTSAGATSLPVLARPTRADDDQGDRVRVIRVDDVGLGSHDYVSVSVDPAAVGDVA